MNIANMLALSLVVLCTYMFSNTDIVEGHSWLSCPPSFNTNPFRGGHQTPVCEPLTDRSPTTFVKAGDRLKVGWPSNNHGGGFVRISLVPENQHQDESIALRNVLKFVCYGHDTRAGRTRFGDCQHPCDGRGGCDYPTEIEDKEGYDTTVGIPTNLPDGIYILQTAMLVGNGFGVYYSCGKLSITGGNPSFNCKSDEDPITYSCFKSAGPNIIGHELHTGAKRGDFCFHKDGTRGTVDDNFSQPPVNRNCDPRISCGLGVTSTEECVANAPTMDDIIFDRITNEPIQETCPPAVSPAVASGGNNKNNVAVVTNGPATTATTAAASSSSTATTIATSITTTTAVTTNEVDEKDENKQATTTTEAPEELTKRENEMTKENALSFYAEKPIVISANILPNEALFVFQLKFVKSVPRGYCWQLQLQFSNPFHLLRGVTYAVWYQGMLVARPGARTMIVQQRPFTQAKVSSRVLVGMQLFPEEGIEWNAENMRVITSMIEVKPISECFKEELIE